MTTILPHLSSISSWLGLASAACIFYISLNVRTRESARRVFPCLDSITFRALNLTLFMSQVAELLLPQWRPYASIVWDATLFITLVWGAVQFRRSWRGVSIPQPTREHPHIHIIPTAKYQPIDLHGHHD